MSVPSFDDSSQSVNVRRRKKRKPVVKATNTIAACNYLAKNKMSLQKKEEDQGQTKNWRRTLPSIVISNNDSPSESDSNVGTVTRSKGNLRIPSPSPSRRDSLGTIALKAREKSLGKDRRKSQGDMSHIRAKWLLGFNLTTVS